MEPTVGFEPAACCLRNRSTSVFTPLLAKNPSKTAMFRMAFTCVCNLCAFQNNTVAHGLHIFRTIGKTCSPAYLLGFCAATHEPVAILTLRTKLAA